MSHLHKKEKLKNLKEMHEKGELSDKLYEKAIELEKKFQPYIFKRAANGNVKSIVDILGDMKKEREAKQKKKAKTEARKKARLEKKKKK